MDLEERFKKETGFDAYIDNNLEPKIPMGYYVEWLEEQLKLCGVSNQRELLIDFCLKMEEKAQEYKHLVPSEEFVDKYLKGNL